MSSIVVVTTTVGSEADAREMADQLVRERLAACVQMVPIHSIYRWKGAIEAQGEVLVAAKTPAALAERLMAAIRARHKYELPEIIVTPVTAGHPPYLAWVSEETADPQNPPPA